MALKNPTASLAKWKASMQNAGPAVTAGVKAVTVAPNSLAAAAGAKYQQGVNLAVSSGKWANSNNAVTLQSWQNSTVNKGVPNIATGVAALSPTKQANMMNNFNAAQQISQQIQAMPKGTLADSKARVLANIDAFVALKAGGG